MRVLASIGLLCVVGCAPSIATTTSVPLGLRPYSTLTPLAASPVQPVVVTGLAPVPSPTPYQYTVRSGDTLSQLAERFHVSLDALLAANPDVNPNALPLGQALKIPSNPANLSGEATPTPVAFPIEQAACHPITDGGLWCFILIHNDGQEAIENVTAQVTLAGPAGQPAASQTALLPLDLLLPGQSLPLSAFFPPGSAVHATPQVQILTANRVLPGDPRYLAAEVQDTAVSVSWSGLTAQISGRVMLPADSKSAALVWVAAVGYDRAGNVVGLRRWEASSGLAAGGNVSFAFMLSSVAGRIERVDFAVEARP